MRVRRMLAATLPLLLAVAAHAADKPSMDKPAMSIVKPASPEVAAAIHAMEEKMNVAFKAKDVATCVSIVDAGGMMIDATGITPTTAMASMIPDFEVRSYSMDNYQVVKLAPDTYLATYLWKVDASYKGQALPAGPIYASTVWVKHGKDWKGVFHQESAAMPAPGETH